MFIYASASHCGRLVSGPGLRFLLCVQEVVSAILSWLPFVCPQQKIVRCAGLKLFYGGVHEWFVNSYLVILPRSTIVCSSVGRLFSKDISLGHWFESGRVEIFLVGRYSGAIGVIVIIEAFSSFRYGFNSRMAQGLINMFSPTLVRNQVL
jgi:hypothetical protein